MLSTDDLRDLFTLREDIRSDTHDSITCERCDAEADSEEMTGTPDTSAGKVEDIGEFAKVAGCAGKLRSWERQVCTTNFSVECHGGLNCKPFSRVYWHVPNALLFWHSFLSTSPCMTLTLANFLLRLEHLLKKTC